MTDPLYTPEIIQRVCPFCGAPSGSYCRGPFIANKKIAPHKARKATTPAPDAKVFPPELLAIKCPYCEAEVGEICLASRSMMSRGMSNRKTNRATKPHSQRVRKAAQQQEALNQPKEGNTDV